VNRPPPFFALLLFALVAGCGDSACRDYMKAVNGPMVAANAAMNRLGEQFTRDEAGLAEVERFLAEAEATLEKLGRVRPGGELAAAHEGLVASLEEVAGAVRAIGEALAANDLAAVERAEEELVPVMERHRAAVRGIALACSD
jgi:hypothetical protein